ncbi:hypothetical protein C8F01DRAFT_1264721 [Mycena amicta]|nr:hypothetical protein C8F01DRAFT_1264721 [Mycena amicta]
MKLLALALTLLLSVDLAIASLATYYLQPHIDSVQGAPSLDESKGIRNVHADTEVRHILEHRDFGAAPNTVTARPVRLINIGFNRTAGTFDLQPNLTGSSSRPFAEVLLGSEEQDGFHSIWIEHRVAANEYSFLNEHTGAPLIVYHVKQDPFHTDYLFTVMRYTPSVFEVLDADARTQLVHLLATVIYDGSSIMFSQVSLRKADGTGNQRWKIAPVARG